ncbi:MAG: hypothetical protein Q8K61_01235 [Gallionella sp.]|nr:hypothetical protein [Gallionella sp.]
MEDINYRTSLTLLLRSLTQPAQNSKPSVAHHQHVFVLGPTPQVLIDQGLPELPLAISGKVLDKVYFDHGISKSMLERLYPMLCTPKAIYRSADASKGNVVMTFEMKDSLPIIVPIKPNSQMAGRRNYFNVVTSVYAKAGDAEVRWAQEGLLMWKNELSNKK